MKGTATVFAAVYAAVLARTAHNDEGRPISISWEKRRDRALTESQIAVNNYLSSYNNNAE